MRMQKRKFRIGELAKHLNVERFVIRFWEKEFNLKSSRSYGGQRFYNEKDVEIFNNIKELLYEKGFTISGAKKQLFQTKSAKIIASKKTSMNSPEEESTQLKKELKEQKEHFEEQIMHLQQQLRKLRDLL
ncbi:MAG: MerR family transcriptional regulator [bacterium]|nr:MerR family transcriptional regulator [bacterium]